MAEEAGRGPFLRRCENCFYILSTALKDDGSVVTWGDANNGGDSSTVASELNN